MILAAACGKPSPDNEPKLALNAQQVKGSKIFKQACSSCHNDSSDSKGPSLKGLFRKQYLPSGLPVNDRFVEQTIVGGRGVMPGLGSSISDQQLDDLVAYLHML